MQVRGAADQIVALLEVLKRLSIPEPSRSRLLAFLTQALASTRNKPFACWLLGEFQNLVPKVVPKALRPQVIADVTRIRAVLGC